MDEVSQVHVRIGTPDDVFPMMTLALNACQDNGLTNPNPRKLLADIWAALNLDHGLVGIIGTPGEEVEACILMRIEPLWYSDDFILNERAIFVDPKYRSAKGGRASRLCEFAKKVQVELSLPLLIGILSTKDASAKERLYRRKFGESAGAYWIIGAKSGAWKEAN
jgi:hypothetical protein